MIHLMRQSDWLVAAAWLFGINGFAVADDAQAIQFFESRIRPLLHASCFECHNNGPDSEGGLQLDSREHAIAGGEHGPAIVPGSPAQSLLINAINRDGELKMPPDRPLTNQQQTDLTRWVADGAIWPAEQATSRPAAPGDLWSLKPIQEPPVPQVADASWAGNPIDCFILAKLEAHGLKPAPAADKSTLLRRLTFDLTGLPPTTAEIEAFLHDDSPQAVEHVVDRLLASPHYGERWARHWLDLVRFAETNGYEKNIEKPNAYRYRDYCIEAFNTDVPYDQFVREHIAGDLLDSTRLSADGKRVESPIGTAFLWFQEMSDFVVDWPMAHAEEMENQIDVLGKSILGLSLSCARCHDHKFDPISTADYYSLAGVLSNSTDVQGCIDSPSRTQEQDARREAMRKIDHRIDELICGAIRGEEFKNRQMEEAAKLSAYLAASREWLQLPRESQKSREAADSIAAKFRLDPAKLRRWLATLTDAAAREDRLFGSWLRLSQCSDDVFAYRRQSIASALSRQSTPRTSLLFDFESGDYRSWVAAGAAFSGGPEHEAASGVTGYAGHAFASSHGGSDAFTGALLSPRFRVDRPNLGLLFLIAGGNHPGRTCVNLIVHSQAMHQYVGQSITANNSHQFQLCTMSLSSFVNRDVCIELLDDETGPWGHIMADHFCLYEAADQTSFDPVRLNGCNTLVRDLLLNPAIAKHADLDLAYQSTLIATLTAWHDELLRYQDHPPGNDLPAALRFVRTGLDYEARNELLGWALGEDSLLATPRDAEECLSEEDLAELARLRQERKALEAAIEPSAIALITRDTGDKNAHIQLRGNAHRLGDEVPRGQIACLPVSARHPVSQGSGRKELADWLSSRDNPLTPRVIVNRIWQKHFGRGLVATPDDFGSRGQQPTHPELLDYLAARFMGSGWSIMSLHRLIVLSRTYQQASAVSAVARENDPENHWLSHAPIKRLDAECIRDALLAVSGQLDRTLGGPSISMKPPVAERNELAPPERLAAEAAPRRSLYLEVRRAHIPRLLSLFDFPNPENCVGQRATSVMPLQSLAMLDDSFVVTQSRSWSQAIIADASTSVERIRLAYLQAFCRAPTDAEVHAAEDFLVEQATRHSALGASDVDQRTWHDFCHLMFNLSEFIFLR